VARDDFKRFAEHTASGVDLLESQLPPLAIGFKKGRLRLVAVNFANTDRLIACCGDGRRHDRCNGSDAGNPFGNRSVFHPAFSLEKYYYAHFEHNWVGPLPAGKPFMLTLSI